MSSLTSVVFPTNQRRTLDELEDRLDLDEGDTRSKRSAFWIMLTLSGLVAVAGVIGDSTATVIGAMIIAPLSTPILGIGVGVVTGRPGLVGRSVLYVLSGVALVVALGALASLLIPNPTNVLTNSQVLGRTSPGIADLFAAIATGFAGALAITRKDVGDVLPGVAIAISLVPPLGVVGVCLGSGAPALAAGALVLFLSNVVALVIAAIVVLLVAGYGREAVESERRVRRGVAYVLLAVSLVLLVAPMVTNTLSSLWAGQIQTAADAWLEHTPDATVQSVDIQGDTAVVSVLSPDTLPPVATLQAAVDKLVPIKPTVVVQHTVGERIENG